MDVLSCYVDFEKNTIRRDKINRGAWRGPACGSACAYYFMLVFVSKICYTGLYKIKVLYNTFDPLLVCRGSFSALLAVSPLRKGARRVSAPLAAVCFALATAGVRLARFATTTYANRVSCVKGVLSRLVKPNLPTHHILKCLCQVSPLCHF